MATVATSQVKGLASAWGKLYKSAKLSGIVPDRSHLAKGGYHCSREDQVNPKNYSVVRPDDKGGPTNSAAAIDMTMNAADMKSCTSRLAAAYDNTSDPRRKYINAFNGCTNGKTATRYDVYARKKSSASKDHVWHVHLSIRRKYTQSATAMTAILSLLKGESLSSYLKSVGGGTGTSSSPSGKPAYPGELKRNDKQASPNANIKKAQEQLNRKGQKVTADGFFGAGTEKAVKAFQKSKGLDQDGRVGPKTWETLWS
jgi:murein L,D-transpeptidase YcbB/YkuD